MNDGINTLNQLQAYGNSCQFPIRLLTHFALKKDLFIRWLDFPS